MAEKTPDIVDSIQEQKYQSDVIVSNHDITEIKQNIENSSNNTDEYKSSEIISVLKDLFTAENAIFHSEFCKNCLNDTIIDGIQQLKNITNTGIPDNYDTLMSYINYVISDYDNNNYNKLHLHLHH